MSYDFHPTSWYCMPQDMILSTFILLVQIFWHKRRTSCVTKFLDNSNYIHMHVSFRPIKLRSALLRFVTVGCTIAKKDSRDLRVSTATVFSSYVFKAKYFVSFNLICLCSSSLYCYKGLGTWIVSLRSWLSRPWVWTFLCKKWNFFIVSLNL